MNKVDIGRVLAVVKQRSGEFVGAVRDTAVEFTWDLRDAADAGFGVPKLISSVASLSVAVGVRFHQWFGIGWHLWRFGD